MSFVCFPASIAARSWASLFIRSGFLYPTLLSTAQHILPAILLLQVLHPIILSSHSTGYLSLCSGSLRSCAHPNTTHLIRFTARLLPIELITFLVPFIFSVIISRDGNGQCCLTLNIYIGVTCSVPTCCGFYLLFVLILVALFVDVPFSLVTFHFILISVYTSYCRSYFPGDVIDSVQIKALFA